MPLFADTMSVNVRPTPWQVLGGMTHGLHGTQRNGWSSQRAQPHRNILHPRWRDWWWWYDCRRMRQSWITGSAGQLLLESEKRAHQQAPYSLRVVRMLWVGHRQTVGGRRCKAVSPIRKSTLLVTYQQGALALYI